MHFARLVGVGLSALGLAAGLACDVAAQQPARPQRDQQSQPAPSAAPQSQAMTLDRLPPHFEGADVLALIADLTARLADQKDPFETTAAFEARRRKRFAQPAIDGLPLDAERFFVLDAGDQSRGRQLSFNADRGVASWSGDTRHSHEPMRSLGCEPELGHRLEPPVHRASLLFVCPTGTNRQETVTETAFTRAGVQVTISASYRDYVGVILCNVNLERGPSSCDPFRSARSIPLDTIRARELLGPPSHRLRVAVVGRVEEPYVVAGNFRSTPTLDNLSSSHLTYRVLALRPSGLLFFDRETGEILLRLPQAAPADRRPPGRAPATGDHVPARGVATGR